MSSLFVRSQLIRDGEGRVRYARPEDGTLDHYQLGVWIEGPDRYLDRVAYGSMCCALRSSSHTHSFEPHKQVLNKVLDGGGMFMISATIHFTDGSKETQEYFFAYELPPDDGTNYVRTSLRRS